MAVQRSRIKTVVLLGGITVLVSACLGVGINNTWVAYLHDAAATGNTRLISSLLAQCSAFHLRKQLLESRDTRTALDKAKEYCHASIVQILSCPQSVFRSTCSVPFGMLDCGQIEQLHDAAQYGDIEIVKSLISQNTSVIYPNHLKRFVEARDNRTALIRAAENGHVQAVRVLRQAGVNPEACNGEALKRAACKGHAGVVKLLLDSDIAIRNMALVCAAENGKHTVVRALCAVSIDALSKNWALEKATRKGFFNVVRVLCSAGADPNMYSSCGEPMLSIAAEYGHVGVVKTLYKAGAHLNARDTVTNSTAFDKAEQRGHSQVVNILRQVQTEIYCPHRTLAF